MSLELMNQYQDIIKNWKPKSDIELETSLISQLLADSDGSVFEEMKNVTAEMFEDRSCRAVYSAICRIRINRRDFSYDAVCEELRNSGEQEVLEFCERQCRPDYKSDYPGFYVRILKYLYLRRMLYRFLLAAPVLLDKDVPMDTLLEKYAEIALPINKLYDSMQSGRQRFGGALNDAMAETETFVPHYIVKGDEKYKVFQSKYKPSEGGVWINNKFVREVTLLRQGFEKVF